MSSSSSSSSIFSSAVNLFSNLLPTHRRDFSTPSHEHTPVVVPIYRRVGFDAFPDEILYEIFLDIVIDGFTSAATPLTFKGLDRCAPWNIGAVCSDWRRVCLSNARLWSYVVVSWHHCLSDGLQGYDGTSIVRTYLQLERSRKRPLHVDAALECDCRCAFSALRALGKECHRWKSVNIVNTDMLVDLLTASLEFPQLEALTWQRQLGEDDYFTFPFTGSTNLRSVKLIWFNDSDPESPFPWSQLTHLNFYDTTGDLDDVLDVISQCAALTKLQFSLSLDHFSEEEEKYDVSRHGPDSVVLQHLSSLDFTDGFRASASLLPCFRLPSLQTLVYNATCTPIAAVTDFIDRSACSLKMLELHTTTGVSDLPLLRERLQQLESLAIRDISRTHPARGASDNEDIHCDETLQSLTINGVSPVLYPRLKHLELHNVDFDPVLLVHMVDSRQDSNDESISPLQSVTVSIYGSRRPKLGFYKGVLVEALRKRMQDGLEVHFYDTDRRQLA